MNKEQMQKELEELIYRNFYPNPDSDRIQPLSERSMTEQLTVKAQAEAILKVGYTKLPYDVETKEEWEYCLQITPKQSGEPLNRDEYWGRLKSAQRDLRYFLNNNKLRFEQGLEIHFSYGIVRRLKTVAYGDVEVVAKVRDLP